MNYIIRFFLIFWLFFSLLGYFSCAAVFWNEVAPRKVETIREMQESATKLKKQQEKLKFQWSTFQVGNKSLGDILRHVSEEEIDKISIIVSKYQKQRSEEEKKLQKAIRYEHDTWVYEKHLLVLKKNFYTDLLPFVSTDQIEDFKKYINYDVQYNEKSKKIHTEIQVIETKKKERIEEIQEQIEDNNKLLRKRIKERITKQVQEILWKFISQDKFQKLDNAIKIQIFRKIQKKVQLKIKQIKEGLVLSSISEEKILLLETIYELLDTHISTWSE